MKNAPISREVVDSAIREFGVNDFSKATIREVKAIAARVEQLSGVEFIKMEMGVPGLPPSAVGVSAEIEALRKGIASLYPDISGLPELKKEASRFVKAFIGIDIHPEGCVPVTGSMQGSYASFLLCMQCDRKKDTILFIDPGFPVQKQQVAVMGGKYETFDVYQYDNNTGEPTGVRNTYGGENVTFTKAITLKEDLTADPPVVPNADLNCGADLKGWTQGYRSIKFFPDINDYNVYSRNQDNDVPIFRYADIILMKCEAIKRGGTATNGDTPMSLFNQIRAYVNAPQIVGDPSLQDILDERGREFLDEHWRRNDLIRFGDFERDWGFKEDFNPNAKNPQYRLWPLSINVLNSNTNWEQNPGY